MLVTPNTLPVTGAISRADLNALGNPTVALEDADIAAVATALSSTSSSINWFANSDFRSWVNGTSIVLPASNVWTELADSWEASTSYSSAPGTGTVYARAADTAHTHVIYCAQLTGEAASEDTYIGQKLSAQVAAAMVQASATITVEVENVTGATRTVSLLVDSCDVFEDYSAMTNELTVALGTVPANTTKIFTKTFDVSASATALRRGGRVSVKLPGLAGSGKIWRFYYAKLEAGTVATPRRIERGDAVADAPTEGPTNYARNPALAQWMSSSVTCTAATDNATAEGWVVIPSTGNTGVASRDVSAPDDNSLYSLLFTGATAVTGTVDFAMDIPRSVAGNIGVPVVFTAWIYNATGSSITPTFRVDSCDAVNSSARTNVLATAVSACGNAAWTQIQWAFDAGALNNYSNGMRMSVRFASNTLDAGAKSVKMAQPRLTIGTSAAVFTPPRLHIPGPLASTARTAAGLRIAYASGTTMTVTCSAAVCEAADGSLLTARNVSVTLSVSTNGANGIDTGSATAAKFYQIFIISNGETNAAILHREDSGSAVTLPAGYRWISGCVGVVRLEGIGTVPPDYIQAGAWTNIAQTQIHSDAFSATYTQVTVASGVDLAVPTTAISVRGSMGVTASANQRMAIAASSNGAGELIHHNTASNATTLDGFQGAVPFTLALTTAQGIWVKADLGTMRVVISAYELP